MRTSLCTAVLVLLAVNVAGAQILLTEREALARLSAESPRVRALRAQVERARADVAAAERFPNPRLTLSREAAAGVEEQFFLVTQALPVTGRRSLEVRAAEAAVRATEFRVGDIERRARAELRLAFATLREQQGRQDELATTIRDLRELGDVLARRERAGDAAGFDRLRAERELLDLEADLAEAEAARVQAQAAVAAFFFPAVDPSSLRVVVATGSLLPLPAIDELIARAEGSRGELLALDQEVQAARLSGQAASRRNVPEPEVVAGLKTSNLSGTDRGTVLSILAAVPLFDRSQPEKLRAAARERQAMAELEWQRAKVRTEIPALLDIVARRRTAADQYRTAAIAQSDELRRIARVSYDAGERGILELLDAYRSSSVARIRLAELETAAARAEIELEYATGWDTFRMKN